MGKRNKTKKNRNRPKSGKNRTLIADHIRQGSELLPPLVQIKGMSPSSWMNDRLPEMLWAILIRTAVPRDYALGQFRRILKFIGEHEKTKSLGDITLTGIAKLDESLRDELIAFIVKPPEAAHALATLLLFESLPARNSWDRLLPHIDPDLELLMNAVGATLWHQSEEATDCRWIRLMARVVTGKVKVPKELAEEWFGYPNEGDQRKVRPSIRAAELVQNPFETPDLTWAKDFWDDAWQHTPCFTLVERPEPLPVEETITRQCISEVSQHLREHWSRTHSTTAIDAKHDGVFGMTFYSLRIFEELFGIGIGNTILGRLGLRTILEVRINLRYLLMKNDEDLWKKWRIYGAGQAKLNALKFDDYVDAPKHIDTESIEQIAGEDIWEEFLTINLASWSGLGLRRLSEQSQLKSTYDKHYSWTSGYAHGMWGPIRESCYRTCGNPLHRLHRYPEQKMLPDTVHDAATLVDDIFADLDQSFPDFPHRLLPKRSNIE